jgi:5'-nucleotidase (lipoprotein e(P4) family)
VLLTNRRRLFACSAAFALTLALGYPAVAQDTAPPGPKASAPKPNEAEASLNANLYMQVSAEYRALCIQTYALALERLKTKLATTRLTDKKPAIVMDLDETVFDNGAYEAFLDRQGAGYTDASWEVWERDFAKEVRLVPGAKSFIQSAEALGVKVVYLSNRLTKYQTSTIAALTHTGLSTEGISERLMLKETTSDKSPRRQVAEQKYAVLIYFGDNLRDFSERFVAPKPFPEDEAGQQKAIAARAASVDDEAYHFGNDWFILPNPVYGEWQRLLGKTPRAKLYPSDMPKSALQSAPKP